MAATVCGVVSCRVTMLVMRCNCSLANKDGQTDAGAGQEGEGGPTAVKYVYCTLYCF